MNILRDYTRAISAARAALGDLFNIDDYPHGKKENDMKATNKFPVEISVSHGTLRNQDLIPAFLEAVSHLAPAVYEQMTMGIFPAVPQYAQEDDDHEWWYTETAYWVLEQLDDVLNDYAPDGYYFGAHEGDGSDFGFWKIIDEEE